MKYSNHISPVRYPYYYAEQVVDNFNKKHSRVSVFVSKKIGMDPREFNRLLIKLFMYRNGSWNSIRDTLKYVETHGLIDEMAKFSRKDVLKYLTDVKYIVQDVLIDEEKLLKRD